MIFYIFKKVFGFFLLIIIISLSCLFPVYSQKLVAKGRLIGAIKNERNEPLVGAVAKINNRNITVQTDINGNFEVDLDPGTYTATISYVGHETKEISDIIIKKGEIGKQEILLKNTGNNLQNIVVTATSARKETVSGVYRIQKNNTAISDVLSTEQIRRTPDNNVAQSLSRMNGVTVTQGKFVVIRGMGERYNNVLINGSQLPSTEPDRKNFSFDLLPAALIDNIIVTKTATPDLPADFAGGVVMVNTKEVPEKNTFYFQAGSGYNSNSTGKAFYSTKIDQGEYLSFLNSKKKWYLKDWSPVEYFKAINSTDQFQVSQAYKMNAKIPNYWGYYHLGDAAPTQEYQAGIGLRKKINPKSSFGVIAAATYRNEQLIENYTRQTYFLDSASGNKYSFTTNLSGLLSFAYNVGKTKFSFKNIYSRRLNYDTYIFTGRNNNGLKIRNYGIYGNMVGVFQNRLEGEHAFTFKDIKLKWFIDRSKVNRDQPETRTMSYFTEDLSNHPGVFTIDIANAGVPSLGGIFASNLNEERFGGGFDLQIPYTLLRQKQLLKLGFFSSERTTDYTYTFLRPIVPLAREERERIFYGLPDYAAITERYLREGLVMYKALTTRSDSYAESYTGKQKTVGGYALTDFKINDKLRLVAGLRLENFDIKVNTANERDSSGKVVRDSTAGIKDPGFFPSANIIYGLSGKSNLRLSYSSTTARPDFRELSAVPFYDFTLPGTVLGNTFLTNTSIHNIDLRYELYPTPSEIFTLTLFYKHFKNPIETLAQPTASGEFLYFNVNQASSTNIGAELDIRKSLAFINDGSALLKNLFISSNASYMSSNVKLDRFALFKLFKLIPDLSAFDSTKNDIRKRPLQGLSPYSINAGILYQGEKYGFNIVFNRFGKRLVFLGTESYTDYYENPRNVLDLQIYGKFLKQKLEARLNISDIFNNYYIYYNNSTTATGPLMANDDPKGDAYNADYDFASYRAKRGTGISLALSYRL